MGKGLNISGKDYFDLIQEAAKDPNCMGVVMYRGRQTGLNRAKKEISKINGEWINKANRLDDKEQLNNQQ